jgi:hypothetical protein
LLDPQDPDESIGGWLWRPAQELGSVADFILEAVHSVQRRGAIVGAFVR